MCSVYIYQGVGDLNYYKLFLEKDLELVRSGGAINILIPSGFQTDKGCSELRDLLINKNQLHELVSFENRATHAPLTVRKNYTPFSGSRQPF